MQRRGEGRGWVVWVVWLLGVTALFGLVRSSFGVGLNPFGRGAGNGACGCLV